MEEVIEIQVFQATRIFLLLGKVHSLQVLKDITQLKTKKEQVLQGRFILDYQEY